MVESTPEALRQQILLNHFTNATGCSHDQANKYLQIGRWQFETALSLFFQEGVTQPTTLVQNSRPACPPCNTPATPPCFPDALLNMAKLQTCDWSVPQTPPQIQQPSKVLASCNFLPHNIQQSPNDRLWLCNSTDGLEKSLNTNNTSETMDVEMGDCLPQMEENQPSSR